MVLFTIALQLSRFSLQSHSRLLNENSRQYIKYKMEEFLSREYTRTIICLRFINTVLTYLNILTLLS